jgi:glycosyltransferase involved in cell wall biosynthesis
LGYDVYILTTEQKHKKPCYLLSEKISLVDLAINYVRVKSYLHPTNLKKIPSHFLGYHKTIQQIQPDFIISCNYAFDFYWMPFTFKSIPKLKEFHSSRFYENEARKKASKLKKLKYILNDYIESKFTRLILLNPDELPFYSSTNKVVISNPIQLVGISSPPLRKKTVIAAGRIAPVKGFDVMIKAWHKVSEQCPDWHLHIYGDGEKEYIHYLQHLVDTLHLVDKVTLHGATNALRNQFLKSSIYLMTSKTECYPMVLLEAMDCGLPIVTYDSPTGPRNIVTTNSDGFVVDYEHEALLVEKIVFLMQNEKERFLMGERAMKKAESFSVATVMVQWQLLFKELTH